MSTSGSTSPKLPRFLSARGGATLPVAVERRRGCAGRFTPLPDAERVLRAAVPGRAGVLRGAAVRRLADDGAAGLRPAPLVAAPLAAVRFVGAFRAGVAFRAADDFPAVVFAAPGLAAPDLAVVPLAVAPDGFFGAAFPWPAGVVPFAPWAPAPDPAREVDDGRAPEPRAGPEGRAGRREEGMA